MSTRVVEQIDDWESEPFGGGYARLNELADEGFSGVVQSMAAKLCFLNGTAVGILDGSIEDFEDGNGTVHEAPSPALPLLALMQERSDEVKAKYYTEETPISEVDSTLSDGGFSGYIELSENVLSGDYYVVYHAGRSMAAAYVGSSGQLLTDDEAFERADDEVGIYEVRPVDVEPVDIPESDESATVAAATDTESAASGDETPSDDAGETTAESASDGAANTGTAATADSETRESEAGDSEAATAGAGTETESTPAVDDAVETAGAGTDTQSETGTGTTADTDTGTDTGTGTSTGRAGAGDESRASGAETGPGARTESRRESTDEATTDETADTASTGVHDRSESASQAGHSSEGRSVSSGRTGRGGSPGDGESPTRTDEPVRASRTGEDGQSRDVPGAGADPEPGDRDGDSKGAGAPDQFETRAVPSLDPARTTSDRSAGAAGGGVGGADQAAGPGGADRSGPPSGSQAAPGVSQDQSPGHTDGEPARGRRETGPGSEPAGAGSAGDRGSETTGRTDRSERVTDLEADLEEVEAELERVESDLAAVEEERDDLRSERDRLRDEREDLQGRVDQLETDREELRAERDELREERDDLQSEVDRLRSQLQQLEDEYGAATDAERRLSPAEALEGTHLLVRYDSKGGATLETAHDGGASREEVRENLELGHHTEFEASNVSVAGKSFEEFLHGTIEYRFVCWVVYELLFEIRDTGTVQGLQDLYDAIPNIDRVELNGEVTAEYTEDGQERRTQEAFDVVLRDRQMGNPLIVANLNDSRQAATESEMNSLVTAASRVGESKDALSSAFLVTKSYFEPEALGAASEATSGGLLSRDRRQSFVKLSRKRGYHLCLAEVRDDSVHLTVPEL